MIRPLRSLYTAAVLRASRASCPPGRPEVRHVRLPGFQMLALANEDVGREIVFLGRYEERDAAFLERLLRPDDICFDVGANTGFYSMLMASRARAGEVHSFEPLPLNWHLLSAGAILNRFAHIRANNAALGDREGEVEFSQSRDTAFSSIRAVGRRGEERKLTVRLETLDGYAAKHGLPRIDVIKIDVEGAEALVVDGGRALFGDAGRQPRVAMIELFGANLSGYGTSIAEMVSLMGSLGYEPYAISRDGTPEPFETRHHDRNYNVFFVSRARGALEGASSA